MKKILSLLLILIVGMSGTVFADMAILNEYTADNSYEVEVYVTEGWNLISGFGFVNDISQTSEIKRENIISSWYFSPVSKNYLEYYPNMNEDEYLDDIEFHKGDDSLFTSAKWVYSDKEGLLVYSTAMYMESEGKKLKKGWNFVSLTPNIINNFEGSCNIIKSYFYDSFGKSWLSFPYSNPQEFSWDGDSVLGYGLVVKVENDCNLGIETSITPPPVIPN